MTKEQVLILLREGWDDVTLPSPSDMFPAPRECLGAETLDAYDLFAGKKWDQVACEDAWGHNSWLAFIDSGWDYYLASLLWCMLEVWENTDWEDSKLDILVTYTLNPDSDPLRLNKKQIAAVIGFLEYFADKQWVIEEDHKMLNALQVDLGYWRSV